MTQNTKDAGASKRFLYSASIESAAGWQTFYVDAATREEADERAAQNDTDGIYAEEVSVEDLGRLVFDNETAVTDFGDFPPTVAPTAEQAEATAKLSTETVDKPVDRVGGEGQEVRVLEGWRFVPVKINNAMIDAANNVPSGIAGSPPHWQWVWDAMLDAAPAASTGDQA